MNTFEEYVYWLTQYLEEKENKEICNYAEKTKQSYSCDLAPKNSVGDPSKDESARPTVIISISEDEKVANLRRIYLNNKKQGIGTKIVTELIKYCKNNGIRELCFCNITTQAGEEFFSRFGYNKRTSSNTWIKYIQKQ